MSKEREKMSTMCGMIRKCSNSVEEICEKSQKELISLLARRIQQYEVIFRIFERSSEAKKMEESYILVYTTKYSINIDNERIAGIVIDKINKILQKNAMQQIETARHTQNN